MLGTGLEAVAFFDVLGVGFATTGAEELPPRISKYMPATTSKIVTTKTLAAMIITFLYICTISIMYHIWLSGGIISSPY
jgi:hypothetical protein